MQVGASLQRDANQLLAALAKRVVRVWHTSISWLRSSVWSLMMPAAGAASLEALTIRRCQRRGTWTLGTTQHGRGGGAVTSPWWGRTAQRGPCALWRVTPPLHFHISLHAAERQSPSQMFYFGLFKFWPAFPGFCLWRRKRWRHFNQQQQHRCQVTWKDVGVDDYFCFSHNQSWFQSGNRLTKQREI